MNQQLISNVKNIFTLLFIFHTYSKTHRTHLSTNKFIFIFFSRHEIPSRFSSLIKFLNLPLSLIKDIILKFFLWNYTVYFHLKEILYVVILKSLYIHLNIVLLTYIHKYTHIYIYVCVCII